MFNVSRIGFQHIPDFRHFSKFVLSNQRTMPLSYFASEFGNLKQVYLEANCRDYFCKNAGQLAEELVHRNNNDFASIIYSTLAKVTGRFPIELERYAIKGVDVARRNGDYIHEMARLNDLRKIYYRRQDRFQNYLDVLYSQERCLKKITSNYDEAIQRYKTLSRKPASRDSYLTMLAYIQTELSKLIWQKHPKNALSKLQCAQDIYRKNHDSASIEYVTLLMLKIKNVLQANNQFNKFA